MKKFLIISMFLVGNSQAASSFLFQGVYKLQKRKISKLVNVVDSFNKFELSKNENITANIRNFNPCKLSHNKLKHFSLADFGVVFGATHLAHRTSKDNLKQILKDEIILPGKMANKSNYNYDLKKNAREKVYLSIMSFDNERSECVKGLRQPLYECSIVFPLYKLDQLQGQYHLTAKWHYGEFDSQLSVRNPSISDFSKFINNINFVRQRNRRPYFINNEMVLNSSFPIRDALGIRVGQDFYMPDAFEKLKLELNQ